MKYIINRNTIGEKVRITFGLDCDIKPKKLLKEIGTYKIDLPEQGDHYITGVTTSKFNYLLKSTGKVAIGNEFRLKNSDITAKILVNNTNFKKYVLYTNTPTPIEYIDYPDNLTIFKFKRTPDENIAGVFLLAYNDIIEEPKIISNLFIDRGVNNVFDPIKRLRSVKSNLELEKAGFGFYTIRQNGNINT